MNRELRIVNRARVAIDLRRSEIALVIAGLALLLLLALTILIPAFRGTLIIDPVAFTVGPVSVRWYGLMLALAIGTAYEWSRRRLIAREIDAERGEAVLWWAVIGGILGARLGFVAQNAGYFGAHPAEILAFTQGGLSIHGAVLVGALAVFLANRPIKIPYLLWADIITPAVLLGAIIGRFGNFLNYELYGSATELPWKMFVPIAYRMPGFESSAFFHPTFLYEALGNLIMLVIVLWFERRVNRESRIVNRTEDNSIKIHSPFTIHHSPGTIFLLTIMLYSITRFLVEFIRLGDALALGLTLAQWVSAALIAVSLIALVRRRA